jgi:Right handed beta helix region
VVHLRSCSQITLRDTSVHGAYLTMGRVNEQMHGVFVAEGCTEIVVERVRVHQTAGDGIRFLGSPTERVRKVWINGCRLIQNKRSGLAFQRSVEQVWVRGCVIEMTPPSTDACLDFEPTGDPAAAGIAPRDIIIDGNMMVHGTATIAVSLSGRSDANRLSHVQFTNNLLIGGSIFVTDVDRLLMRGNIVVVPADGPPRIPLNVARGGRELSIVANLLVNENPQVDAVLRLSRAAGRGVQRAVVADNLCRTGSGSGILLISATDVAVTGNTVVSTGAGVAGVLAVAENAALDGITIRDNHISIGDGAAGKPESGSTRARRASTTSRSWGTPYAARRTGSPSVAPGSAGRRSAR